MKVSRDYDPRHISIGKRVRSARLRLNLSQVEVGRRLGVSYQQINKYEQGKSALSGVALLDLADLLKVSVGWLLGEVGVAEAGPPVTASRIESRVLSALSRLDNHAAQLLVLRFAETLVPGVSAYSSDDNSAAASRGQPHLL
jgi:transcriptional regulator with XRE-family HTH domain